MSWRNQEEKDKTAQKTGKVYDQTCHRKWI